MADNAPPPAPAAWPAPTCNDCAEPDKCREARRCAVHRVYLTPSAVAKHPAFKPKT